MLAEVFRPDLPSAPVDSYLSAHAPPKARNIKGLVDADATCSLI
jgi:hypothetical protein